MKLLNEKLFKRAIGCFFMKHKINDLIFKELIKRGYSLRGNTRVWNIADSKLWYLTPKQAQAHLNLELSKEYAEVMTKAEIALIKKSMQRIKDKIFHGSAINIIDIGCGDGKKAVIPIDILHKETKLRYCPIDISSFMVSKAISKISKVNKGEIVKFRWNISDFDNVENIAALLRDNEFRQNFLLFLGSTISNFEFHEVVYEIVEAMNPGVDYLLMSVALGNKSPEEILKSYRGKAEDEFFGLMLTQIGFKRDEIEFDVRYQNSRVEIFYCVKKDKTINFGDASIEFYEGDQIIVGFSHRYSEEELRRFADIYFEECEFFFNGDRSWVLLLCKR
jgi:uncharacterized SAM-dependent methyltransferase